MGILDHNAFIMLSRSASTIMFYFDSVQDRLTMELADAFQDVQTAKFDMKRLGNNLDVYQSGVSFNDMG